VSVSQPLRILSVEDNPQDTQFIQDLLEAENIACEVTRVETEEALCAHLEAGGIDLILADYTLPSFNGLSALRLTMKKRPDVPFIFVSGTLGEEIAIEALKIGATDYVVKTRPARLAPAVRRAIREAQERTERQEADDKLRRSEAYLAAAQQLSRTGSFGWDVGSGQIYWSRETFRIFEVEPSIPVTIEVIVQRTHPEDRVAVQQLIERVVREKKEWKFEHRLLMSDGSVKYLEVMGAPTEPKPGKLEFVGAVTDITGRKRAEVALQRSEGYLAEAQKLSLTGSWAVDVATMENIYWSRETYRIFGLEPAESPPHYRDVAKRLHPEDIGYDQIVARAIRDKTDFETDYRLIFPDGSTKYVRAIGHPVVNAAGEVSELIGTAMDVTEQYKSKAALEKAFEEIRALKDQLYDENIALREEINRSTMFEEIVGDSPALQNVLAHVIKVAPTDSTVLITGETGTGKELIARAIHNRSTRAARPFISVNCAAVPSSLIASELFGHEKGAFTDAVQRRLGRFELAEGGTIFLDEIGELPPDVQITLLRVLQEREFERLGGLKVIKANVRVIAATNRDLSAAINAGTFRSDLFYRLHVFPIEMPSLRNRREDIPLLAEYFMERFASKNGKRIRRVDPATLEQLAAYSWPGNIRELQNVIERSVIVCDSETLAVDESWFSGNAEPSDHRLRAAFRLSDAEERRAIETALEESRGRISGPAGAAVRLGIPASTLDSKIKVLKIDKHRFKDV
jgi:DNA-binding NtrC family response regulator